MLTVAAIVVIIALAGAVADRSAQVHAWRRIADERRWDHERRTSAG